MKREQLAEQHETQQKIAAAQKKAAEEAVKSLARDRREAQSAHVDMSVFGIVLGEPLRVPACPETGKPSSSCMLKGNATEGDWIKSLGSQFLGGTFKEVLEQNEKTRRAVTGNAEIVTVPIATVTVYVGASARPDWLPLPFVDVATIDGHVVRITLGPLGGMLDSKMESVLTAKYKKEPSRQRQFSCVRQGANLGNYSTRIWSMPGLQTSYVPSTALLTDCGAFVAQFETATYRRLLEDAREAHEAAQPKL